MEEPYPSLAPRLIKTKNIKHQTVIPDTKNRKSRPEFYHRIEVAPPELDVLKKMPLQKKRDETRGMNLAMVYS